MTDVHAWRIINKWLFVHFTTSFSYVTKEKDIYANSFGTLVVLYLITQLKK